MPILHGTVKCMIARRGFTLVELLVVISIIGLLSSVVLTGLNNARISARDTQRAAQATQFIRALEIYFATYGNYPCAGGTCGTGPALLRTTSPAGQALIGLGAIAEIPEDPTFTQITTGSCNSDSGGYCYCSTGGTEYVLTINTEDDHGGSPRCYLSQGVTALDLCPDHVNIWSADSCGSRF